MSAAFCGNIVEKHIKIAASISTVIFPLGLLMAYYSLIFNNLWLLYFGVGVCMGIGEGIAYLCPIKNMILWFSKSKFKGLIMAISIVSFGIGATLCTWFYSMLYPMFGL